MNRRNLLTAIASLFALPMVKPKAVPDFREGVQKLKVETINDYFELKPGMVVHLSAGETITGIQISWPPIED